VNIQGYATDEGSFIQGIAVAGPFLGKHHLLAYRENNGNGIRVLWDGQGVSLPYSQAGVELSLSKGSDHFPSKDVLMKVFGKEWSRGVVGQALDMWMHSSIFAFKLPEKVEVFMMFDSFSPTHRIRKSVQVMVKMPPKGSHGGWCGDFNGIANDDFTANYKDPVPANQNWFKYAPDLPKGRSLLSVDVHRNVSRPELLCEGDAHMNDAAVQEVIQACAHLMDADIRDACIQDICTDRRGAALEAADDIAIFKAMKSSELMECEPKR